MKAAQHRRLELAMPWLVIVGLLIVWQGAVKLFGIASFVLPAPSAIFEIGTRHLSNFAACTLRSMTRFDPFSLITRSSFGRL